MSRTDEEIKRYETKMKSCTTMTDLLVAMSSWQSYAQSHNLSAEEKRTVDEAYLKACRENARAIVRRCGWQVIDCAENGAPRTPEDIHNEVYRRVRALL